MGGSWVPLLLRGHKASGGRTSRRNIIRVSADVREWLPPYAKIAMLFAFPPCTDVAVSGARWFQDEVIGPLIDALELFEATREEQTVFDRLNPPFPINSRDHSGDRVIITRDENELGRGGTPSTNAYDGVRVW